MGARGARAIPSRLKKGGEKEVDLRPHTYVRTRGAKYRDARISAAHTQCVDTRTYVRVYVRTYGRRYSAHL